MAKDAVNVGLIGLGTVGGGVAQLLLEKKDQLSARLGAELVLKRAADLDQSLADQLGLPPGVYTADAKALLQDPEIDIIVELIGGLKPALSLTLAALEAGKLVATANKALLAHHGAQIYAVAQKNQSNIAFEASVGGGIPLIRSLRDSLAVNRITSCLGILNGTCNYILTRMFKEGTAFGEALADAQAKGYAESDPSFDVEGTDTAHKLAIIAALVTGRQAALEDIPTEGITNIAPADLEFAREFGCVVKLLAIFSNPGGRVEARVHPALVPQDHMLASVNGAFNALFVSGDWVDEVLLYGRGAGRRPTASAVVSDVLDLARDRLAQCPRRVPPLGGPQSPEALELARPQDAVCQYYFRFTAQDQPGVLAVISRILGENGISIQAVIQKGRQNTGPVPIVMLTHSAAESSVINALGAIDALEVVAKPTIVLRKISSDAD